MKGKKNRFNLLKPFGSIRTSMIGWFCLLIVLSLLLFSFISFRYTEDAVTENSTDYTMRVIGQVSRDIDYYIGYMENISAMVTESTDVQNFLFGKLSEPEKTELYRRIVMQFRTVTETRQDISNIAVVAPDRKFIINDGTDRLNENIPLDTVDWYSGALNESGHRLTASHVQHVIRDNYKWVVTLGQGIVNPATGKREAVFFIDLNYKLLKDLCENNSLVANSYVFIIDEMGQIIYHPRQQLLYSGLTEEKIAEVLACPTNNFVTDDGEDGRLYTISVSEKTGWRVVGVAYLSELMRNREEIWRLYLLTATLLLTVTVFLATLLAGGITRPIKELVDSMKEVEKGNFGEAQVAVVLDNEIGSLGNSFNLMTVRIRELMEANIHEQEEKRKSELKALRSQINPHFLYNTLDSIIWMAEGGRQKEVVRMTAALARLLRQSISNDSERIPLAREIEYTRNYLTIQQMRYRDKLEYEIDVAEELEKEEVINLILQPLVENAIYHGIKYKETKGIVRITGYSEGGNLVLKVTDDGVGMDSETLARIFDRPAKGKKGNSVGVNNVQTRIRLYYGVPYGLHFESAPEKGTTAIIRIPKMKAEEPPVDN